MQSICCQIFSFGGTLYLFDCREEQPETVKVGDVFVDNFRA
jgi:hypothetical protein